jgi:hypothetical protein
MKMNTVPLDSMELVQRNDQVEVLCKPCSKDGKMKYINPGTKEKAFTSVKAHVKRSSHLTNVKRWTEKKPSTNTSSPKGEDDQNEKVQTEMAKLEMEFPGIYSLVYTSGKQHSTAMFRCFTCNQLLCLFPERGSVVANASQHAKNHATTSRGVKRQGSLDNFFQVTKKQCRDSNQRPEEI